jgi:hypothetical protein
MQLDEQAEEQRQSVTRVSADLNDTFSPGLKNSNKDDRGRTKASRRDIVLR